jgi:hypothetical protein
MFEMSQRLGIRQLLVAGGMTETVFPAVEKLLDETEYQKALAHVSGSKDMNRYHSIMDFLFCEIFINYRYRCFAYYAGEKGSKKLRDQITEEARARYEKWLVAALGIALKKMEEARKLTWTSFRAEVLRLAA